MKIVILATATFPEKETIQKFGKSNLTSFTVIIKVRLEFQNSESYSNQHDEKPF